MPFLYEQVESVLDDCLAHFFGQLDKRMDVMDTEQGGSQHFTGSYQVTEVCSSEVFA